MFESIPETIAISKALMHEVMLTGKSYRGEEFDYTISKEGKRQLCYFNFTHQLLREIDNTITGVICAKDVTSLVVS